MNKLKITSRFFLIIALIFVIFTGCDRIPGKVTKPLDIISIQHNEKIKKDDHILIDYDIKYPQIKDPKNIVGLIKINEFYKKKFDEMIDMECPESEELAEEDFQAAIEGGYDYNPHSLGSSFEVKYNDEGFLSINLIEYTYWGGAHPNSFIESAVFDINSEQILTLAKLYKAEEKVALNAVLNEVRKQIEDKGFEEWFLFDTALENLEESYYKEDFYFDGENIVVYFQQYAIAPYAAGFPEFKIPLKNIPYFQK